jgi:hypothetical protein
MSLVESFRNHGYVKIENAIDQEFSDFVTQYALFDEMQDFSPDGKQVVNAHAKYGDPVMETLLLKLQDLIEQCTGLTVFPTYSFFRVYRNNDELVIHKDRPSCEISATLCFNYSYDSKKYVWPIYMENNSVVLNPTDLVIYRGCDLNHWREKFCTTDNDWHVQGFFHYVDANGPYADYKFDKRESIGVSKHSKKSSISHL